MGAGGFGGGIGQCPMGMNLYRMNPMMYWMYMMNLYQQMNLQYLKNNQNNQNNFTNFGAQGGNSFMIPKSKLPTNFQASYCPFPLNYNTPTYNIIFDSSGNFRMTLLVPFDAKMKDVFRAFIQKAGLQENVLGKYINFLFNGLLIDHNEEKTVYDFGIRTDFCTIVVLDTSNLLGGKNKKNYYK